MCEIKCDTIPIRDASKQPSLQVADTSIRLSRTMTSLRVLLQRDRTSIRRTSSISLPSTGHFIVSVQQVDYCDRFRAPTVQFWMEPIWSMSTKPLVPISKHVHHGECSALHVACDRFITHCIDDSCSLVLCSPSR